MSTYIKCLYHLFKYIGLLIISVPLWCLVICVNMFVSKHVHGTFIIVDYTGQSDGLEYVNDVMEALDMIKHESTKYYDRVKRNIRHVIRVRTQYAKGYVPLGNILFINEAKYAEHPGPAWRLRLSCILIQEATYAFLLGRNIVMRKNHERCKFVCESAGLDFLKRNKRGAGVPTLQTARPTTGRI